MFAYYFVYIVISLHFLFGVSIFTYYIVYIVIVLHCFFVQNDM
jgi:hypothetical protein